MDVLSPAGKLADDDDLLARVPRQAARLGDRGQDGLPAEELERARLLDRPDDRDAPAAVLQDVDGHLGLEDDLFAGESGQLLLDLELAQVADHRPRRGAAG